MRTVFKALEPEESCMATGELTKLLWVSWISLLAKVCDIAENPQEVRCSTGALP